MHDKNCHVIWIIMGKKFTSNKVNNGIGLQQYYVYKRRKVLQFFKTIHKTKAYATNLETADICSTPLNRKRS